MKENGGHQEDHKSFKELTYILTNYFEIFHLGGSYLKKIMSKKLG